MAQAGFTPISLYYSTTAAATPSAGNLVAGELALNTVDEKLYFKNSAGTVKLLASNATSAPVLSFQTSLGGLTPSTATTGVVTLAGTLNTTSGGTGLTTFTAGDVPYYAAGTLLSKLAIGTAGQILTSTGTAPQWSTLSSVAVTTFSAGTTGFTPSSATSGAVTLAGTLVVSNGGTGLNTLTAGYIPFGAGTSAFGSSANLFWDNTNSRLGIGTALPTVKLQVNQTTGTNGIRIYSSNAVTENALQFYHDDTKAVIETTYLASGAFKDIVLNSQGGNLGLGVTPSAWTTLKVMQFSGGASFAGFSNTAYINANCYFDGSWRYIATTNAGRYEAAANHKWFTSTSGTAGAVISETQTMALDSSGRLGIATTSPTSLLSVGTLGTSINPAIQIGSATNSSGSLYFGDGTASDTYRGYVEYSHVSDALLFGTSSLERIRIDSAGTFILKNDYQEQTYTANSSTAITLNIVTNGTDQVITLTGTATITMPTATAGKSFLLKLKTGAGAYTVTWSTVKWPSGTAPTLTSTASRMDIFSFFSDGTNWYGTTVGQNYTP